MDDKDPRGVFGEYVSVYDIQDAVDDKGNSLIPPADVDALPANVHTFGNGPDGNTSRWDVGATLHYPRKGAGTRIVRLRWAIPLLVQARAATLELP